MKKIVIIFSLLAVLLCSCKGNNKIECFNTVQKAYPESEIRIIPGHSWSFLVRHPEGTVLYIRTMNYTNTDISHSTILFKANKE